MWCATSNQHLGLLAGFEELRRVSISFPRIQPWTLSVTADRQPLPSASVIIATKNRPQYLGRTVTTLLAQSAVPEELIIVDQSAGDESRRGVELAWLQAPPMARESIRLQYVKDPTIRGLAQARNRSMKMATAEVWVFLDDDVILEPDFLEELLKAYGSAPGLTGVSGVITNYSPPPVWQRTWNIIFRRGPFHDERQPIYWRAERLRQADPIPVKSFTGALMSFRASAVRDLGFDENLSGVSEGEDVDFCCRLPEGARLVICPRARLAHMLSPEGRAKNHWLRRMVLGTHFLYWKNWRRGVMNRIWFLWLNVGCGLLASVASVRRVSLTPWRDFLAGVTEAKKPVQQSSVTHP